MSRKNEYPKGVIFLTILLSIAILLAGCTGKTSENPKTPKEPEGTILSVSSNFTVPAEIPAGEPFLLEGTITNKGSVPISNINAVFYNFGPNIEGCPEVFLGSLEPKESIPFSCEIVPKLPDYWADPGTAEFSQEISVKFDYSYDISGAYDSIRVLSPSEYNRVSPQSKTETKETTLGPVTLRAEFKNQPAMAGREFPISLSFLVRRSDSEGIESFDGIEVGKADVKIPEKFSFSGRGNFDTAGSPCGDGYICAEKAGWRIFASGKNGSTLTVMAKPPEISVPEETFSARFDASGFTLFRILKKKVTVLSEQA